jgi:nucleotide-binding universal stress UspA family protein
MYRSILVPLDGTPFGEHALPVARGIAHRTGATLHLVHVHSVPVVPAAVESLPYLIPPLASPSTDDERAYLDGIAAALADEGIAVTREVVVGPLTEALERCARTRAADLVVACTHCHEGLSRFWHRGVGEQILHDTAVPLLLIRAGDHAPEPRHARTFRHILIPLNGLPFAEEVLDHAVPLGRDLDAHFTLLRVVHPARTAGYMLLGPDAQISEFLLEEEQQEAQAYLERVAERLRTGGLRVRTRVVVDEEPARGIVGALQPAGLPPVDLIAMLTHSRGPLTRLVLSSVTDEVLHHSPVPLLLCHPQPAEEESVIDLVVLRNRFDGMVEREA